MFPILFSLVSAVSLLTAQNPNVSLTPASSERLSSREFSLTDRYPVQSVSTIFKDNILLNMFYLEGKVQKPGDINWNQVEKPFTYTMILKRGQTFAFHDSVLPEFSGKVTKTTNAHFTWSEGFKSDGYLVADGVCHLASLINWAARDAGLNVVSPTPHDFAVIPEVPKKYGVAIYDNPDAQGSSALQNLYITNSKAKDIAFVFTYDGKNLKVDVNEL